MIYPVLFACALGALGALAPVRAAAQERPAAQEVPEAQEKRAAPKPSAERPAAAPEPAPPSADPADVASLDAIVAAVYDVISGPAGEPRDWDRFRSLFVSGARLIPAVPNPQGGAAARVLTVEDYIRGGEGFFKTNGFFEREIGRRTDTFGNIAHLFSTYESRHAESDPAPFQRGINSMQLLKDGDRWWFVTIYWEGERPGNPIPEEYLETSG